MMLRKLFLVHLLLSIMVGQPIFIESVISTSADYATGVYTVDVDGDGDMDVLSTSANDSKVAWYENDGSESFTEHVISDSAISARDVFATDVDGDGDLDAITCEEVDNLGVFWFENPLYDSSKLHRTISD